MSSLQDWLNFRRGENPKAPKLTCIECGRPAQGNVSCDDGEICDACHTHMVTSVVSDATLELCDVICNRYNTEELCEHIVADVELRAQAHAWGETYIGRMVRSGVKVRLECKTLHERNTFVA